MYDNIIIDTTNLFFRSVYFGIENHKSIISIPKSFLSEIENIKNQFANENSIFWFLYDDSQFLFRRELDSNYKTNREKNKLPKILFSILGLTQELLKCSNKNYRVISGYGLESDDFIQTLTKQYFKDSKNILISYDLDFARCINKSTDWFNWKKVFNETSFVETYSFYPNDESVKLYKSLNGYKSDNIEIGVKDLNHLTLFQICRRAIDYNSFDDFKNDLDWIDKSERSKIIKSFDKIELNYELCNFIPLSKGITEYIDYGSESKIKLKILLESLGLQLKLSKEEIENEFFNLL